MPKSKSKSLHVGEVRGYLEAGWLRVRNKISYPGRRLSRSGSGGRLKLTEAKGARTNWRL